jgi:hypothetical protein
MMRHRTRGREQSMSLNVICALSAVAVAMEALTITELSADGRKC